MYPLYPASTISLTTLSTSDVPMSSDLNEPNRELEAIATELGANLKTIIDTTPPVPEPINVAALASMFGYIVKTMLKTNKWSQAALPSRGALQGHAGGAVVGAGSTAYLSLFQLGSTTFGLTEAYARCYIPYACAGVTIRTQITSAQPAGGTLTATLRKNGVDQALASTTTASSTALSVATGTGSIALAAGDYVTIKLVNTAASASAGIGAVVVEIDQKG